MKPTGQHRDRKFAVGFACGFASAALCLLLGIFLLEKEIEVPLSLIPEPVLSAARAEFPDFEPVEAELVLLGFSRLAYEVEGLHEQVEYELLISSGGKVLSVELED